MQAPRSIFSNEDFIESLWDKFDYYNECVARNLDNMKHEKNDDYYDIVDMFAKEKMRYNAEITLAHHKQKLKKSCKFGDCPYLMWGKPYV